MKKLKKALESTITFDAKIARRFSKTDYNIAQGLNMSMYEHIEAEKARLSTPKWDVVSDLLASYRGMGEAGWKSTSGKILLGLYKKNSVAAKANKTVTNTKLLDLISRPEMLLLAYRAIKGNKGALTGAAEMDSDKFKSLNSDQQRLYLRSLTFPDKFNLADVLLASKLIRLGTYPWGSSKRVYVPKPGAAAKMRPITIPPFLDRVVQKSIAMVLEAIYEPFFEIKNRSFGFRPNKGVHDAITAATSNYTSGKITAIEGDIEAAYDTVNKETLLNILSEKIADRKFINFLRHRLSYDFVEIQDKKPVRIKPKDGIPQGGIDSPYLFNIYMSKLDDFVDTEIQDYLAKLNLKTQGKRSIAKAFGAARNKSVTSLKRQQKIKAQFQTVSDPALIQTIRISLFAEIKKNRYLRHIRRNLSSSDNQRKDLKLFYVRYADDWILLFNGDQQIASQIKEKIANFLLENLSLKLSPNKTIITDIRKEPAKFLGFYLKHPARGPIVKKLNNPDQHNKFNLQRKAGTIVWSAPDSQRLINKFHMKGFCDRKGFPRELPWLSCLEAHVIIERYNSVMRGFAEFYFGFIRNNSAIQRWIYILKFSCLKTLAQKYSTNISGIFKKFGHNMNDSSRRTLKVTVLLKVKNDVMQKDWILWTYKDLLKQVQYKERVSKIRDKFWDIELKKT